MGKISIIFVDVDETYVMALEKKFVEEIGEYASISIITDMYYFGEYFSVQKNIDILVINEQLYNPALANHNIGQVFILTENPTNNQTTDMKLIYKYTSVIDVFSQVATNEKIKSCIQVKNSSDKGVISVYSPSGGSGKTTIALGLAVSLGAIGKKVIYISTEDLQTYGVYFDSNTFVQRDFESQMASDPNVIRDVVKNNIGTDAIDYLLPFKETLNFVKVTEKEYINVIESLKKLNYYDFIIIDTDSIYTQELCELLNYSDRVVVVTNQEKMAAVKLKKFVECHKGSNDFKYTYICNKYNEGRENDLINHIESFYIKDYIYFDEKLVDCKASEMIQSMEVQKLANVIV